MAVKRIEIVIDDALVAADADQNLLAEQGWRVTPASEISTDLDAYRNYLQQSRGEFTVAKDQNVRLRSGWFSERSAQYLAAGRPVITQETGFSNALPTGRGLFGFSTMWLFIVFALILAERALGIPSFAPVFG